MWLKNLIAVYAIVEGMMNLKNQDIFEQKLYNYELSLKIFNNDGVTRTESAAFKIDNICHHFQWSKCKRGYSRVGWWFALLFSLLLSSTLKQPFTCYVREDRVNNCHWNWYQNILQQFEIKCEAYRMKLILTIYFYIIDVCMLLSE